MFIQQLAETVSSIPAGHTFALICIEAVTLLIGFGVGIRDERKPVS